MTSIAKADAGDRDVAQEITCIITDVDGVMTDGRIIYDSAGQETKQFHVRDGLGIKHWMKAGFAFGILTSRTSKIVAQRAQELGIVHVQQGASSKLPIAESMFASINCQPNQVCYIGDDLPDLPVMHRVGLAASPADAATDVKDAADWILDTRGGDGVLRELIERLLRSKQRWEELLPG
jgi:3-deoxy-D-manno-octulosonate 8-phosphate phosphatase (KDO 8-P phosphatase)